MERLTAAAELVRLICFHLLGAVAILQAARGWVLKARAAAMLHLLAGFFLLASGHYMLTHNPYVSTFIITPVLLLWLVAVLVYLYRVTRK